MLRKVVRAAAVYVAASLFSVPAYAGRFAVEGDRFTMDGRPYQVLSGEMHFARIPEAYWADRLQKARAMGLNTVCTYVFWNYHQPEPGPFDFTGNRDLRRFISLAGAAGLNVIIRIGPYACAEWDFGGIPWWLLKDRGLKVRSMYPPYLEAAENYIFAVADQVRDLQDTHGGPIIMVQVENEYGSYSNDRQYMEWVADAYRRAGFDIQFFTSDGPEQYLLNAGTLPEALPVVNFSSFASRNFGELEKFRPGIPQMSGEFWVGWFTHWHDRRWGDQPWPPQKVDLDWMLKNGKSFNLYMFHGGTNWGFWAGANHNFTAGYQADITSYDYDAPLDEAGRPTAKFRWLRERLRDYQRQGAALPDLPPPLPAIAVPEVALDEVAPLFDNLPPAKAAIQPDSMEQFDQGFGFILYRTKLRGRLSGLLTIQELHDYGSVFVDGRLVGELDRHNNDQRAIRLPRPSSATPTLDILVENMGRINFGPEMLDRKGITEYVALENQTLTHFEVFNLPMDENYLAGLKYRASGDGRPAFYRGSFELAAVGDTFLDMRGWHKGVVWVNGHNLGRFWDAGPQHDLFLPGCWLKVGVNEIVVFDLVPPKRASVSGTTERRKGGWWWPW